MHGNNEDSTALLGDSEVFAVKHTPRDTIPELIQRLEYDCEVSSSVASEKAVHVFEDNCSWHASSNEAHKFVKESRLAASKSRARPHSRKREILAGESCCPNICSWDIFISYSPDVAFARHVGPMARKNVSAEGFNFALENGFEPGVLEPEFDPANS
jgi:hypothetical protein